MDKRFAFGFNLAQQAADDGGLFLFMQTSERSR
jgi:hypothetical protein